MRANFTWVTGGQVVYALTQGVILVVLAKLQGAETVGRFALALAIVTPIAELAHMRLRDVLSTDAAGDYSLIEYVVLTSINGILALGLITAISLSFGYGGETLQVILVVACTKVVELLSFICYGAQSRAERMDRLGISLVLRGTLGAAAMTLGVVITGDLAWGAVGMGAAWLAVLAYYDVPEARHAHPAWKVRHRPTLPRLRSLAVLALPLGIMQLLISLAPSIPRVFLEQSAGAASLGVFAGMAYLVVGISTVARALAQTMAPRLGKHYAEGNMVAFKMVLKRQIQLASLMGVIGLVGAVLFGRPIVTLLYGAEFGAEAPALVALMFYAGLLYVSMQLIQGLIAARWLRRQMFLALVVIVITLAAGFILIPAYGVGGAVAVLIIAGIVRLVGSAALILGVVRQVRT